MPRGNARKSARSRARAGGRVDKKAQILDVASEWFLTHGYAGTSITEMARKAGISKESIYRYFKSKQALLEAVIDKELEHYEQELEPSAATDIGGRDFRGTLVHLAETIVLALNSDRTLDFRRLIFQESRNTPHIGQHYFEIGPLQAERKLIAIFEAHREKTDFEPEVLAVYFAALVGQRLVLERECRVNMPTDDEVQRACRRIVDDFLKAYFR